MDKSKIYSKPEDLPNNLGKGIPTFELERLQEVEREYENRQIEALKLYEPLPWQDAFHRANNKEVIARKANQAGGAGRLDQLILTPTGWTTYADIKVGDKVIGGDGKPCNVTHVFPIIERPTYRMTFDDGASTVVSGDHNWRVKLTKDEKFASGPYYKPHAWRVCTTDKIIEFGGLKPVPYRRAYIPVAIPEHPKTELPISPYALGALIANGSMTHGSICFDHGDSEAAELLSDELPDDVQVVSRGGYRYGVTRTAQSGSNAVTDVVRSLKLNVHSYEKFIPSQYMFSSVEDRIALLQGLMDNDGYCSERGDMSYSTSSPQLAFDVQQLVRSLGGKCKIRWKPTFKKQPDGTKKRVRDNANIRIRLPFFSCFRLTAKESRQLRPTSTTDFRVLYSIEPLGNALTRCISVDSPDNTYVTNDYIVTHNSLAGFVEVARALTGRDPYYKYPLKDGVCVCLGYGEKHIGRVIHKYLFRAGAFRIIRDRETRQWRTYRPWPSDQEFHGKCGDLDREAESKPAPPLIPQRYIDGKISWEKRAEFIFSYVKFTTGWELYALNSAGEASQAQGFQVDLYDIDEDLASPGWLEEAIGRTAIRKGKIRWHAVPQAKTEDLMNMIARAEDEEEQGVPEAERTTRMISATMYDNPYYPEESKKNNERIWRAQGEDIFRKRALGEVILDSVLMYPTFNRRLHEAIQLDSDEAIHKILRERNGVPPAEWCRYMIVDPGHTVCAVEFVAVPPPSLGDYRVLYDELYMQNCDKHVFARGVKGKIRDDVIQDFIIDEHGGKLREIGSGILPKRQYEMEMEKLGIKCVARGSRFRAGSPDVKGREEKLREWLSINDQGIPKLMVVGAMAPNFCREIARFKKKTVRIGGQDVPTDDGNRRANTHSVECLEYAAADGLPYIKPKKRRTAPTFVDMVIEGRKKRAAQRQAKQFALSGSHRSLGPRGSDS